MNKTAIGIAAIATLMGLPALAADMALKAPPPAPAAYDWSGCYVGANAGWIGSQDRYALAPSGSYLSPIVTLFPMPNPAGGGDSASDIPLLKNSYAGDGSGGLIGGQIGCNKQIGQYVFGGEVDGQWTSLKSSVNAGYAAFTNAGNFLFTDAAHTEQASSRLEGLFTIRGRAGYAWDRLLLYVTGGLAAGEIKSQTNLTFATTGSPFGIPFTTFSGATHVASTTADRAGWVMGGGAEYAFAPHWSLKTEILYIDLGTVSYNSPLVAATPAGTVGAGYSWSTKIRERDEVARIGLNYKLN
jgi:outer membrane immunogenic protein